MRIDPRTCTQRKKTCARQVTANFCVRVEDAVRPRAVCLLRFRTGTGWLVRISEAVGISEMPCWRQVAAGARGSMPWEMDLRGSRARGLLKGTSGVLKGAALRNWGSRDSGAWRAPELDGEGLTSSFSLHGYLTAPSSPSVLTSNGAFSAVGKLSPWRRTGARAPIGCPPQLARLAAAVGMQPQGRTGTSDWRLLAYMLFVTL